MDPQSIALQIGAQIVSCWPPAVGCAEQLFAVAGDAALERKGGRHRVEGKMLDLAL